MLVFFNKTVITLDNLRFSIADRQPLSITATSTSYTMNSIGFRRPVAKTSIRSHLLFCGEIGYRLFFFLLGRRENYHFTCFIMPSQHRVPYLYVLYGTAVSVAWTINDGQVNAFFSNIILIKIIVAKTFHSYCASYS